MENKLKIEFKKEQTEYELNILNPDLAQMIHKIVAENIEVSRENVSISTEEENFDTEEFLDILVSVYEEFCGEIEMFFANIKSEIKTYYDDEALSEEIIRRIQEDGDNGV
ncbi:MAG: hypothetical protein J6K04_01555 [Lachnospiraceae bacterium]|nr:hypothetical protein [Lachnospiraceae bacterium]